MLLNIWGSNLKGNSIYSYWVLKFTVVGEPWDDNWLPAEEGWELRQLEKRTWIGPVQQRLHPRSLSKKIYSREMPRKGLYHPQAQSVLPANYPNFMLGTLVHLLSEHPPLVVQLWSECHSALTEPQILGPVDSMFLGQRTFRVGQRCSQPGKNKERMTFGHILIQGNRANLWQLNFPYLHLREQIA